MMGASNVYPPFFELVTRALIGSQREDPAASARKNDSGPIGADSAVSADIDVANSSECFVMVGSCYQFLLFRDRPSIQTMASVCFAMNSIHLVAVLYAAMSADDAIVTLKLNGIESTVTELHIAGGSRFVLYYITIFADLFLIIGIEDNCRLGMLTFIWWNSFRIFLEVLTIVGVGLWKGTSENFTLIMSFLSGLALMLLVQHGSSRAGTRSWPGGGKEGGGEEESTDTKTPHRSPESRNESTKREPGVSGGEASPAIRMSTPQ
ncbi:hypothetical protein HPB51_014841 [Rhipicephalus microplus]|uniref:Uncharacterized protein n=1 Tax=Rhipicephalus microplus TaxID=6941 RepID=A0A9J6DNX0_RHIMP|nr:hypothetical protein HPB51_014841 [Rhipicephalus microplus]